MLVNVTGMNCFMYPFEKSKSQGHTFSFSTLKVIFGRYCSRAESEPSETVGRIGHVSPQVKNPMNVEKGEGFLDSSAVLANIGSTLDVPALCNEVKVDEPKI